jgi:TPR repeat protein
MTPARMNVFREHGSDVLVERFRELCERALVPMLERADIDRLLVLADRLHHVFDRRSDLENAKRFGEALAITVETLRDTTLLKEIEPWLHAVVRILKPDVVAQWERDKRRYNLFDSLEQLKLLTVAELKCAYAKRDDIVCPVRRAMLAAKELRNPETHGSRKLRSSDLEEANEGVAAIVLTTLRTHEAALREATRVLILPPLDLPEARQLCGTIERERTQHKDAFGGRVGWMERLTALAHPAPPTGPARLVVLHGPQGQGKSALMARWSERLADAQQAIWHPDIAPDVRASMTWLPGCLYHSGKASKDPYALGQSLLFQMSALTLEVAAIPRRTREVGGTVRRHGGARRATHAPRGAADASADAPLHSDDFDVAVRFEELTETVGTEAYQWAIADGLRKVVAERGPVLLVVDAVDEILAARATGLDALPDIWPEGVTVIFTVRDGPHRAKLLQRWPDCTPAPLEPMSEADLAATVGLDLQDHAELIAALQAGTGGWAPSVRELRRQRDRGVRPNELRAQTPTAMLDEMAHRWTGTLEVLLLLLALLEPCTGLRLSHLQAWWAHQHGKRPLAPALRRELAPVAELLHPLSTQDPEVRLVLRAFADHARDAWFTRQDLAHGFEELCSWLAKDMPDSEELIVAPLVHWATQLKLDVNACEGVQALFVALYTVPDTSPRHEALQRCRKRIAEQAPELWRAGVRHAAESGVHRAMAAWGRTLIKGDGIPADPLAGRAWLQKAAEADHAPAQWALGSRLVAGRGLPKDVEAGARWLRLAAEKSFAPAMLELAYRLLDADELAHDLTEGADWLRRAADAGYAPAMRELGTRLLDGDGLTADPEEGARWLRKAVDAPHTPAMWEFGARLLKGHGMPKDVATGERWLRSAANEGFAPAMGELGERLLEGMELPRDVVEGERWLRKAAETGYEPAVHKLATALLDGRHLEQDLAEGERWLRKAADRGYPPAMRQLASRQFEGHGVKQDPDEGTQWLRKAAEKEYAPAMFQLAARQLRGFGMPQDLVAGAQWLRRAADAAYAPAMWDLGSRLIAGRDLPEDVNEGARWLRMAAEANYPPAMVELGSRMLDGMGVVRDTIEAVRLLQLAAPRAESNQPAAILYRHGYFAEAATAFSQRLSDPGAANAMLYMLRRGEIPPDHPTATLLVSDLLAGPLSGLPNLAAVNVALCDALGFQRSVAWDAAARTSCALTDVEGARKWWASTARADDPEGHLVLAWLIALHGIEDPEGLSAAERLDRARAGGIPVPDDHLDVLQKLTAARTVAASDA